MGFEVILEDFCIMKKNGIFILYYVDNIIFAYEKYREDEVKIYIKEFKLRYYLIGGEDL